MATTSSSRTTRTRALETFTPDKKETFPPPYNHWYNDSGSGVVGVQKNGGKKRRAGGSPGDLGSEEGASNEDDDPDI